MIAKAIMHENSTHIPRHILKSSLFDEFLISTNTLIEKLH